MKQAGFGVAGASGLVASVFLTLKAILIDSGSMNEVPLVRGMRQPGGGGGGWENTARRAVRSRSWCCWFSACSPSSASTHPVLRL